MATGEFGYLKCITATRVSMAQVTKMVSAQQDMMLTLDGRGGEEEPEGDAPPGAATSRDVNRLRVAVQHAVDIGTHTITVHLNCCMFLVGTYNDIQQSETESEIQEDTSYKNVQQQTIHLLRLTKRIVEQTQSKFS